MGNKETGMAEPSALQLPSAGGDNAIANQKRGSTRRASEEKGGRRAPSTNRNNPATRQLIEWVDTVGVKRAAEILGEAPSTVKRWGVTHTPNAQHIEAFNAAAAQQAQQPTGGTRSVNSLDNLSDADDLGDLGGEDDIEYVDNRPIEEADVTAKAPKDPKQAEDVNSFRHDRISRPGGIQAKLIGRNGEIKTAPMTARPVQRPAQPQAPAPIHNPEVGGRKIMTEAEYKELVRRTHDPVNSPTMATPQQPIVQPRSDPRTYSAPQNVVFKQSAGDEINLAAKRQPNIAKGQSGNFDALLQWAEAHPSEVTESQLQSMRNIFFPWKGRKLFLAFPVIKLTNPATAWNIAQLYRDLGDKMGGDLLMGNSNIDHARNSLAGKFIASESEYLLFIDDDVVVPTGRPEFFNYAVNPPSDYPKELSATHVVERLMSQGKTLIGGLYFGRQARGAPIFHEGLTSREAHLAARNEQNHEVRPTEWVGTGCMLIHRSVFEAIQSKFPDLNVGHEEFEWDYFRKLPGYGEDASFCKRAKEAGHQAYVDFGTRCAHVGFCAFGSWNTDSGIR
jgi:hypothetical protein